MMNPRFITSFIRTLNAGGIVLLTSGLFLTFAATNVSADDSSNYCPKGGSWVFVSGVTPPTVTYTAPGGMEITEYCVGDGLTRPKFSDNYPHTTSLTVGVPAGRRAHASFQVQPIVGYGCMDADAFNYDPTATVNGGCIAKCRWNEAIPEYDESCAAPLIISGCTDPAANNYNPQATVNDQSCEYETVYPDPQAIDPLDLPASVVNAAEGLIPVTGTPAPAGLHLYAYYISGLFGLYLLISGLRRKHKQ